MRHLARFAERKEKCIIWSEEKYCALAWWCLSDEWSVVSLVDTLCLHCYLTACHAGCKSCVKWPVSCPMDLFPHCSNSVTSQILLCRQLQSGASVRCHLKTHVHSLWDHVSTVQGMWQSPNCLFVHDAQCEGEKGVLARVMSSQRPHMTLLTFQKGLFPCGGGRSHALE